MDHLAACVERLVVLLLLLLLWLMVGLIDFVELWCGGGVGVGGGGVHKVRMVQVVRWFLTTLKPLLKVAAGVVVVVVVHASDDVCDEGGL